MPTINIYSQNSNYDQALETLTPGLKEYAAEQLTCPDRTLNLNEISVRLLRSIGKGMLIDVEFDMFAAAYGDRVERQDQICLNVKKFVLEQIPDLTDTNVWLNLNELGHSWED